MKILVVYYSRTGSTRKVAEKIALAFGADIDEITDNVKRKGVLGYIRCGKEAMRKQLPKINETKNASVFDLVVIGTPIWGFTMASPVRAYLAEQGNKLKKVAFFCTESGSGGEKAFREMGMLSIEPRAVLELKTKDILNKSYEKMADKFVEEINGKD